MNFQRNLPGCCSVGILYNFFGGNNPAPIIKKHDWDQNSTSSGAFIAIFTRNQKSSFDKVCEKNTLLSAVQTPGAHGTPLAICVFKGGKK